MMHGKHVSKTDLKTLRSLMQLEIDIDNQKLDGFMEHFLTHSCNLQSCRDCGYCRGFAQRALRYDAARLERSLSVLEACCRGGRGDLNILVCVKPALAGADSAMVTREKAALEISRQDLLAYSCALWLRRQAGGSVTLLAMSSANAVESPWLALYAYGADRIVLLSNPLLAGSDTVATSYACVLDQE